MQATASAFVFFIDDSYDTVAVGANFCERNMQFRGNLLLVKREYPMKYLSRKAVFVYFIMVV